MDMKQNLESLFHLFVAKKARFTFKTGQSQNTLRHKKRENRLPKRL